MPGTRKEKIDRILCVFQAFDVRKKAAGFYCEKKTRGNRSRPVFKNFFFRQPIERVIDFDSVKLSRVPRQHFGRRKARRIEISDPVFVMPPRGPDVNCRRSNAYRPGALYRR
jgi:hypothetical protein